MLWSRAQISRGYVSVNDDSEMRPLAECYRRVRPALQFPAYEKRRQRHVLKSEMYPSKCTLETPYQLVFHGYSILHYEGRSADPRQPPPASHEIPRCKLSLLPNLFRTWRMAGEWKDACIQLLSKPLVNQQGTQSRRQGLNWRRRCFSCASQNRSLRHGSGSNQSHGFKSLCSPFQNF